MKMVLGSRMESMATRVALHPFLAGMNRTQLALLTDCAMAVHFKKGELILHEGEMANRFYLIERGKVVLEAERDPEQCVEIETVGPGEMLGWSCLFPPYVWHFTARALEPTEAILFYGTILREYCERDHSLGYELFKRMSAVMIRRLKSAREKLLAIRAEAKGGWPSLPSQFLSQELDSFENGNEIEANRVLRCSGD